MLVNNSKVRENLDSSDNPYRKKEMNIFNEIEKCKNDFKYFCKNHIKIKHPKRGLISLDLYEYQEKIIDIYSKNNRVIVKKFRQSGITTFTAAFILWICLFQENEKWLFITGRDRQAVEISSTIQFYIENMPQQFRSLLTASSHHKKLFGLTNSSIEFYSAQSVQNINKNFTGLVIEEAAYSNHIETLWERVHNISYTDTKIIVYSTPNKIDKWFNKIFDDAEKNKNLFHPYFANYLDNPEFNHPIWEENIRKNIGDKNFEIEYQCKI